MKMAILMFGFESLPEILAVVSVAKRFEADGVAVHRADYHQPLGALAGLDKKTEQQPYTGSALGGKMLVLCGLEQELDGVLDALRQGGIGTNCLKAVLTPSNRKWNALKLYTELAEERRSFEKRGMK